jgi:hypothetical protein
MVEKARKTNQRSGSTVELPAAQELRDALAEIWTTG